MTSAPSIKIMSRHRTALHDYDGYDDDYDEFYDYDDDEEDEYSKQYAPPSRQNTGVVVGDFLNESLRKPNMEQESPMETFIAQAREILGADYVNTLSEDDIASMFLMFDGDTHQAMNYLLRKYAAVKEQPTKSLKSSMAVAAPPTTRPRVSGASAPPGFATPPTPPNKKSPSTSAAAVTPNIADGGAGSQKGRKKGPGLSVSALAKASTPPLDKSITRLKQNESQQTSLTRSGSKTGLTSSNSSGQLNRAAALSDDDLDPEEDPAQPGVSGGAQAAPVIISGGKSPYLI